MKRREFIGTVAAASASVIAASSLATDAKAEGAEKKYAVKITVLKTSVNEDFSKKYRNNEVKPCGVFKVGQEFILNEPWSVPEGFCDWAWADIRTYIGMVQAGKFKQSVACCTDGYRPVYFNLERIEV